MVLHEWAKNLYKWVGICFLLSPFVIGSYTIFLVHKLNAIQIDNCSLNYSYEVKNSGLAFVYALNPYHWDNLTPYLSRACYKLTQLNTPDVVKNLTTIP